MCELLRLSSWPPVNHGRVCQISCEIYRINSQFYPWNNNLAHIPLDILWLQKFPANIFMGSWGKDSLLNTSDLSLVINFLNNIFPPQILNTLFWIKYFGNKIFWNKTFEQYLLTKKFQDKIFFGQQFCNVYSFFDQSFIWDQSVFGQKLSFFSKIFMTWRYFLINFFGTNEFLNKKYFLPNLLSNKFFYQLVELISL